MSERIIATLDQIKRQFLADKKKTAVLAVLTLILLVVAVRSLIDDGGPAPVKAAAVGTTEPQPERSIETPGSATLSGSEAPFRIVASRDDPRSRPERPRTETGAAVRDTPRRLRRDLFTAPDWSVFPRVAAQGTLADRSGDSPATGFLAIWHRLGSAVEGGRTARGDALAKIDDEVNGLQLQATMTGATPRAFISGRLVSIGDAIDGFAVVRIADRRVSLRKHGVTRTLTMP